MALIDGADYFVRIVDMPDGVNGCISPNPDGTFNIYINSKSDMYKQIRAYQHEKKHIENDDFAKFDVREIEHI